MTRDVVFILCGIGALWWAQELHLAFVNRRPRRRDRRLRRAQWWAEFERLFPVLVPPRVEPGTLSPLPPLGADEPADLSELVDVAVAEERPPLASTAERFAKLRALPAGRHRAPEPSSTGRVGPHLAGGAA